MELSDEVLLWFLALNVTDVGVRGLMDRSGRDDDDGGQVLAIRQREGAISLPIELFGKFPESSEQSELE